MPHGEAIERLDDIFLALCADVRSWGYMGPYRKGIVAGLKLAHLRFADPDADRPQTPYVNVHSVRTWASGVRVGLERGEAAISKAIGEPPMAPLDEAIERLEELAKAALAAKSDIARWEAFDDLEEAANPQAILELVAAFRERREGFGAHRYGRYWRRVSRRGSLPEGSPSSPRRRRRPMTNDTDRTELVAQMEAAEAGSGELDLALGQALGLIDEAEVYTAPDGRRISAGNCDPWPFWTDSLDAAFSLAERILRNSHPGVILEQRLRGRAVWQGFVTLEAGKECFAATPALALCLAILNAQKSRPAGFRSGRAAPPKKISNLLVDGSTY